MRQIIYNKKTGIIYTVVRRDQSADLLLSNWDDAAIFECTDEQLSSDKTAVYYVDTKKKVLKIRKDVIFHSPTLNIAY